MRPRYGPWPPMNASNGMRPPMRGRRGGPAGPGGPPMRGMGPRPPPYPGMGPPMRHFGPPPPMGPRGPPNHRPNGPMMRPHMRPPPPHMIPPMLRPQRPIRPPMKKLNKANANNDGKIKKKKLKFRSFYVTRPWVNDELRAEISTKDKLFDQAKSSNKADDWAAFKEQKDKCVHMYSALKLEFIGQHPEEVFSSDDDDDEDNQEEGEDNQEEDEYNQVEDEEYEEQHYICEPCDRTFDHPESYQEHLKEHQVCGIDGCQFNAHQLLVLAHIKMQHSSGLYDQIRNISTPEDIARWREQRRKNYPSKANILLRYQQQAEMLKRGERIGPNKDRFGRTRNAQAEKREKQKLARKKKKRLHKKKKQEAPVSLIDEKADWNGTMFPFRGTKSLEDEESSGDESHVTFSDDEWDCYENKVEEEVPVLNNALGALMGAYQSDSDEEVPKKKPKIKSSADIKQEIVTLETSVKLEEDDEMTEVPIQKTPVDLPDKATELKLIDRKRAVPVTATPDDLPIPAKSNKPKKQLQERIRPPRRPTLLQKLLDKEIRHERNVILQCVRYVVNNNFFIKPFIKTEPIEDSADTNITKVDSSSINDGASTSKS